MGEMFPQTTALGAIAYVCWGIFLSVWIVGGAYNALRAPAAIRGRARINFLPGWIIGSIAVIVATRLVPQSAWASIRFWNLDVAVVGAALLVASTLLTLWARWTLGTMWSPVPQVRDHHQLRTDGPYRITRHPIYTGILGMLPGSVMLAGFGPITLALLVFGGVFLYRIPREEKLMTETFGDEYTRYQREVPPLLPFLSI
jgi:protein-S-isoprenylcysteine O-methyltransferase Ste14